jgi:hypothetical protein
MTELMANDDMAMNRINPYTSTGTFGVSYNGGHKGPDTQTWTEPADESESDEEDTPEFLDHFGPNQLNKSGSMYLKTGSPYPAKSFMFPARKFQYDDGTTSFSRETVWKDASNYISNLPNQFSARGDNWWPIILVLIVLLFIFMYRKQMGV